MRNVRTRELLRLIALVMVLVCTMTVLLGCNRQKSDIDTEATQSTTEEVVETQSEPIETTTPVEEIEDLVQLEMKYLTVNMPVEMATLLRWEEITEGDAHTTVVFLDTEVYDVELYRICFGAEFADDALGSWAIDGEKVPVAAFAEVYNATEADDEQKLETYSYAMESLQYVMNAIREDERFQREEEVTIEKNEAKTGYWDFRIPENMECVEESTGNCYKLYFYGTVNGERYLMYTVCVGEETLVNVLGTYLVAGAARPVSVESCEPPSVEGWPEAEATKLYAMMDSINDTIRIIMESQGFAALEAE